MKNYHWLFWTLASVGLIVDQGTKYGVFSYLYNQGNGGKVTVIEGAFDIVAAYTGNIERGDGVLARLRTISGKHMPEVNHGALFGIGSAQDLNRMFAMVSVLAAMAIILFSSRPAICHDFFLSVALGLILGGTFGNLYDRVVFEGVRDFLHWHGGINWPVFNIADCCLVCGAGTLLAHAFFAPEPKVAESAECKPESVACDMQSADK
jgi:signal peptidase II